MENGMKTRITSKYQARTTATAVAALFTLAAGSAMAGGTISFGEDKSVSVGFGMRTSYTSISDGAPNGTSRSSDFNLDSIRLYTSASLNKYIKGTFNTERTSSGALGPNDTGTVRVMDAYVEFDMMPEFNIWAGRMLPPSDRANLDGPYYLLAWAYPGVVSAYPNLAVGRDDGVLAWGKVMDKKVVYSVGAFEGRNRATLNALAAPTSNQSANLLYAGRVAVNFWDPEPAPAYYTGSTYFGAADILTVALAGMKQSDGVGSATVSDDYTAWNMDVLMEKKLSAGVVTLEGAYYKYDFSEAAATADGAVAPGKAMLAGAGFLFPTKFGVGQLQPYYRYQKFDADGAFTDSKQHDFGLNYIIDGPNAKISATYTKLERTALPDIKMVVAGVQVQF
jgi:hypothetical protein